MNLKNTLSARLRQRRTFALAGLMALTVMLGIMAMAQQPARAEVPPLRGPFQFIELPGSATPADVGLPPFTITPTVLFADTFDNLYKLPPDWRVFTSTALYTTPSSLMWGQVFRSDTIFTNTLWSGGSTAQHEQTASSTYAPNMDTWIVYGPLDTQQYTRLQMEFDYWLDAGSSASFGWAASKDGKRFCGSKLSGHAGSAAFWQHVQVNLAGCPWDNGVPAYVAFFFQSDASTPNGLGAFVDNVVIRAQRWLKMYMPLFRLDATPAATPTSTPEPYPLTLFYDFEPNSSNTANWCVSNQADWASGIKSLGGSSSYYLGIKHLPESEGWMVMQSPRRDPPSDYRITARFNLLGMTNTLSLADYGGAQFGLIFGVWGAYAFPPEDTSHCSWSQGAEDGGYYEFIIKIKNDGSGYRTRLERHEKNTLQQTITGADVTISRTGWNTLQLDRYGSGIVIYVNGAQVLSWSDSTKTGAAWWGVFSETTGKNKDGKFESNWDDIRVYDLTP